MNDTADRRRVQSELYGAPLSESIARLTQTFRTSQAGLARILGMSAPMLSQLVNAQRIKIGNPVAAQRLQSLIELADEVDAGLGHRELETRLRDIESDASTAMTRTRPAAAAAAPDLPTSFAGLLRAVASGRELLSAAELLNPTNPALAEVLRVYGTGSAEDRERHFRTVRDLL